VGYSLTAGDFNGDRVPDLAGGTRQEGATAGTVAVFQGNRDPLVHGPYVPRQLTPIEDPIALAGLSSDPGTVRLTARGWSAGGRTRLRLDHQVAPMGVPYGAIQSTPWVDTGTPGTPSLDLAVNVAVAPSTAYRWRVRIAAHDPHFAYSPWLSVPTSLGSMKQFRSGIDPTGVPEIATLVASSLRFDAVYPNPTEGACRAEFALTQDARVRLEVFDVAGRRVARLLDDVVGAGSRTVSWTGEDRHGRVVANGVYFLRLEADGESAARKVLIRR
jgi:hypothetical protein